MQICNPARHPVEQIQRFIGFQTLSVSPNFQSNFPCNQKIVIVHYRAGWYNLSRFQSIKSAAGKMFHLDFLTALDLRNVWHPKKKTFFTFSYWSFFPEQFHPISSYYFYNAIFTQLLRHVLPFTLWTKKHNSFWFSMMLFVISNVTNR